MIFLAALSTAAVAAWLAPPEYVAEMTFVIRGDRVDPAVTPDPNAPPVQADVTEGELLSEAEILRSRDLLEQVALDAGLHVPADFDEPGAEARARAEAVKRLRQELVVTPIRRTTFIRVQYAATDPQMAHRVLDRLSERYLDKHLAVHRAAGTQEFFGAQVMRARGDLDAARSQLAAFSTREQVVAPEQERTAVMQQLVMFETALEQARADAADAGRRLAAVRADLKVTPERQVTSVRTANGTVVGQLKARILEMELQRDALLQKFTPQYPAVGQIETQLQHTRASLASAERSPILDETTDQNPTHQWLRNEEARIRSEQAAVGARVASIGGSIAQYKRRAQHLDGQVVEQEDLARSVTAAKDEFLLYTHKAEEARIADALDRTRIANVGIVDPPAVPASQSTSGRAFILWLGVIAGVFLSAGSAYALDRVRPVIHSARDVQGAMNVPVLATVSASAD